MVLQWIAGTRRWMIPLTLMIATALPAVAADEDEKPFTQGVEPLDPGWNWIPWAVAFAFALGVIALAFKNPHRTHLD